MRTAFPSHVQKKIVHSFHKGYWVILIILIVLGIYLTRAGYNAVAM